RRAADRERHEGRADVLALLEPLGQLPHADHDRDGDHADEDGLDDEQGRDDHRAETDTHPYGGTQVTARALLLRGGRRLRGVGHGLRILRHLPGTGSCLRRLVSEQGAAQPSGPLVHVLVSAGFGHVGHDGHGASLLRVVRIVRGTRRGGPLDGPLDGGPPVPGLRRRPPGRVVHQSSSASLSLAYGHSSALAPCYAMVWSSALSSWRPSSCPTSPSLILLSMAYFALRRRARMGTWASSRWALATLMTSRRRSS